MNMGGFGNVRGDEIASSVVKRMPLKSRTPTRVLQQRRSLGGAAIILLALATMSFAQMASAAPPTRHNEITAPVVVKPAQYRVLHALVTGYGKVQSQPAKVQSIVAPHDGTVIKVNVRRGQVVAKGEVIAELDTAAATREVFRKAKTAFDFAKSKLDRMRFLFSKGAATRDQLDQAKVAYKDAKAAFEAQEQVGAQQQLQVIRSPISGTVTAVSAAEGDHLRQGSKISTLAPGDALAVLLGVEPQNIESVKLGLAVRLRLALNPARRFTGHVVALNEVVDPHTRLIDVLVQIDRTAGGDPPLIGTYMRGEIVLRRQRALAVQRSALLYDKKGIYVFVIRNNRAKRIAVKTSLEDERYVAVSGSIKEGDPVVVQGNYELKDGMKVRRVPNEIR